jgi:hypothetical protein
MMLHSLNLVRSDYCQNNIPPTPDTRDMSPKPFRWQRTLGAITLCSALIAPVIAGCSSGKAADLERFCNVSADNPNVETSFYMTSGSSKPYILVIRNPADGKPVNVRLSPGIPAGGNSFADENIIGKIPFSRADKCVAIPLDAQPVAHTARDGIWYEVPGGNIILRSYVSTPKDNNAFIHSKYANPYSRDDQTKTYQLSDN